MFSFLFDHLKSEDPLVLHDLDHNQDLELRRKSRTIKEASESLRNCVFRPSLSSWHCLVEGNIQTLASEVKCIVHHAVVGDIVYDKEQIFTLEDGGQILIQFKGKSFEDIDECLKWNDSNPDVFKGVTYPPLIFMVPGLTSDGFAGYVQSYVMDFEEAGYDVVVINYRGLAGMKLTTPKLYYSYSTQDVRDPMQQVFNQYCRPVSRKVYAVGCSLGANILSNMLGLEGERCFLDGAIVVQAPIQLLPMEVTMKNNWFGMWDYLLGISIYAMFSKHADAMEDELKKKLNLDMKKFIKEQRPSILEYDKVLTAPFNGYANTQDYYYKASCVHRIPSIAIPTLFINALDDPVVSAETICYDVFKQNPNVILATTKHGGHLGYHESMLDFQHWNVKVCVKYFKALQDQE